MRHLWQWFCGYVCVVLKGRQVNRFLNLCSRNGIYLWHITYDLEHVIHAHIRLEDFFCVKPYLRKTKTKMRVQKRKGFPFWCQKHPKLKIMGIFAIGALILLLYSFRFIWQIEIIGNSQIATSELMEYLSEQEIEIGTKRQDIDCAALEYLLRENFEHLSWVSVSLHHTSLCIEIKESLYDAYEFEVKDGRQYDLTANKDGVIFSIVTRSGTALVKTGMYVKEGDVLVRGQCEIFDDAGVVKDTLFLKADATVWADVEYEFTVNVSEMEIMALKLSGLYTDEMLFFYGNKKIAYFIENLEENGVIILDKNVMIDKREKNILFHGTLKAREQIGINIPVEEIRDNEFE